MKQAIIQGVYADLKTIKSRSTVQVIIECPIERGAEIVEAFGFPQPGSEVHVVVARMTNGHAEPAEPQDKERRPFRDLPIPQQAAMCCQEPLFRAWLREECGSAAQDADGAATWLREHFSVPSRKEIRPDEWRPFHDRYAAWKARERAA